MISSAPILPGPAGEGDHPQGGGGAGAAPTSRRAVTTRRARQLRRTMTLPEVLLWRALRARPDGLKFRRQHPLGAYVLDFYCAPAQLAVEIDGRSHDAAQAGHDASRDRWVAAQGITTLRVPAHSVLADPVAAAAAITAQAAALLPLHRPAGGPPPRHGRGGSLDTAPC